VLIVLGLLTPVGAAILSAVMITAAWTAHRPAGLWSTQGGYEYNLVLLAALFALTAVGPGDWSLDNALGLDMAGDGWALAQLGAGLLGAAGAVMVGRVATRRPAGPQPAGR
jgi:putative oxidoreductase